MRAPTLLASLGPLLSTLLACSAPGDRVMDTVFDSCEPLSLIPSRASPRDLASLAEAAEIWNSRAGTRIVVASEAPRQQLPVRFENTAATVFGVYDDEAGVIIINDSIANDRERAITVAHELGHAFGLWHVDGRKSVMNRNNTSLEPTAADVQAIDELWAPCGLTTTAP